MPDSQVISIEARVDADRRRHRGRATSPVITADGSAVSLSEDNIARVFSRTFAGSLLFDHTCGRWRIWDGIRWATDERRLAFNHARELVRTLNTEDQAKWARASVFGAVETIARADPIFARTLDEFDSDPFLLGTPAGIVNLKTGELHEPDPDAMITRVTGAVPEDGEPSLWLKFLNEATAATTSSSSSCSVFSATS